MQKSLVKILLISSTALCGLAFVVPVLADDKPSVYTIDEAGNMLLNPAWATYKTSNTKINYGVQTTQPASGDYVTVHFPNNESQYQIQYITYAARESEYGTVSTTRQTLSAYISNTLFKGIATMAVPEGGTLFNDTNDGYSVTADFVDNHLSSSTDDIKGGAIYNSGMIGNITGDFIGNYASSTAGTIKAFGGAINNGGTIASITGDFIGNYVSAADFVIGGAIYNDGTINSLSGNFIGNYANSNAYLAYGGAIYNSVNGTVTITANDKVNFVGNYTHCDSATQLNDIANYGTLTLKGTMNLDGGISGTGIINVYNGANLGFKVRKFNDGTAMGTSADGTIIADQTVTFEGNKTIKFTPIVLAYNYSEGTLDKYTLFFDGAVTANNVNFEIVNPLYDVTFDEVTGVFTFAKKAGGGVYETIIANGGNANQANLATLLIDQSKLSANGNFNTVQGNVSTLYQTYQFGDVVKATKAMNPDEAPVVSQAATDTVQQVFGLAGSRMSSAVSSAAKGKASGSAAKKEGVWAKGFYGQSKLSGDNGFKNKSWGVGVGFDHAFTPNFMLGVGYAYGQSDIDTDSRDIKAKTHTPVIYAEYKQNEWFIDGMVSYSFGKYDEKKNVTGINDDVDYDVNTFGAKVIGGYAVTEWFIPEVGFTYFNVAQKDYTDNLGNNFDKENANIFTGVIGAKFAKAFEASKGVNLVPELRLAATYDFVRDNNNVDVTLANMHSYTFKGEKLDRFGFEVDAGLKVDAGEFELAARYEGRFRNDFYNHTGLLEARYEF